MIWIKKAMAKDNRKLALDGISDRIWTNHFTLLMTKLWFRARENERERQREREKSFSQTTQQISDLSPRLCPLNYATLNNIQVEGQMPKFKLGGRKSGFITNHINGLKFYNSNAKCIKQVPHHHSPSLIKSPTYKLHSYFPNSVFWKTGYPRYSTYPRKERCYDQMACAVRHNVRSPGKRVPLYSMLVWSHLDWLGHPILGWHFLKRLLEKLDFLREGNSDWCVH